MYVNTMLCLDAINLHMYTWIHLRVNMLTGCVLMKSGKHGLYWWLVQWYRHLWTMHCGCSTEGAGHRPISYEVILHSCAGHLRSLHFYVNVLYPTLLHVTSGFNLAWTITLHQQGWVVPESLPATTRDFFCHKYIASRYSMVCRKTAQDSNDDSIAALLTSPGSAGDTGVVLESSPTDISSNLNKV